MSGAGSFELLRPASAFDAVALLLRPGARLVAGGTDLLPNLRRGIGAPRWLVDLSALRDFGAVHEDAAGWRIGAGLTLAELAAHAALAAAVPALVQAAAAVAGPAHRVAATLGGNLCQDTRCVFYNQSAWWRAANGHCLKLDGDTCHVAPQGQRCHAVYAGDLAPVLMALHASVSLLGAPWAETRPPADAGGAPAAGRPDLLDRIEPQRMLPVHALYRDDGAAHLALRPHELLAAVHLPRPAPGTVCGYRKVRARGAMDFALAGVAMSLRLDAGRLGELTVGITGTNSHPLLLAGTDTLLGRPADEETAEALGKLVSRQVSPMRSTATAAHHRRLVAVAAARRLLLELGAAARGAGAPAPAGMRQGPA